MAAKQSDVNYGRLFACGQMALCVAASAGYATCRDWRRALYWFCAAILTACVTF